MIPPSSPPSFTPTLHSTLPPEMSFRYDSRPEPVFPATGSTSHMSAAPLAYQMYERLRRMCDERKLNLAEEDVLISAYLGPNLVYRTAAAKSVDHDTTNVPVYGPLHVQTDALTL